MAARSPSFRLARRIRRTGRRLVHPPAPRLVERRSHKMGQAPGVLPEPAGAVAPARVSAFHYDAAEAVEHDDIAPEAARALADTPGVTWVNLNGAADTEAVAALGAAFGLHPLVVEDLVTPTQRPKLEVYGDQVFVVARMILATEDVPEVAYCDGDPRTSGHRIEQIGLVLGDGFVLSVQEESGDVFEAIRERIRTGAGRVRTTGADYLLYALLDLIIDHAFVTLERIGDAIEVLEDRALEDPEPSVQSSISTLRRDVIVIRRALWPLREVLAALQRDDALYVEDTTRPYLRDAYDHLVQAVDVLESVREVLSALADLYLSALGMRQNEVMKTLTVVGAIFLPLTFLAGIYGMNFDVMPELHTRYGYFVLLGAMAVVAIGALTYFRSKDWI